MKFRPLHDRGSAVSARIASPRELRPVPRPCASTRIAAPGKVANAASLNENAPPPSKTGWNSASRLSKFWLRVEKPPVYPGMR